MHFQHKKNGNLPLFMGLRVQFPSLFIKTKECLIQVSSIFFPSFSQRSPIFPFFPIFLPFSFGFSSETPPVPPSRPRYGQTGSGKTFTMQGEPGVASGGRGAARCEGMLGILGEAIAQLVGGLEHFFHNIFGYGSKIGHPNTER